MRAAVDAWPRSICIGHNELTRLTPSAGDSVLLKNVWYVAADSTDVVPGKPHKTRVLGQNYVLFRDSTGKVGCLSDICIHRGASLSQAKRLVNGCVECPYHGWQFSNEGACVKIPAQGDKAPTDRLRIDAYPTVEKYGWVWVFFGDLQEAERPPIPDFPEYDDPRYRSIRGVYHWNADAGRVVENGLDFAHAPYVHRGFMGHPDHGQIDEIKVDHTHAWGASAAHRYEPPPPHGLWKYFTGKRDGVLARTGFHISGALMRLDLQISKAWKLVIFDANTPIDEHVTLTRWITARNFFTGAWGDGNTRHRVIEIFDQDKEVLEEVKPIELPYDLSEEYSVQSDSLAIHYRRMRKTLIDRGWGMDFREIRDQFGGRAAVIPSPRRRDPNDRTKWILPEIPAAGSDATSTDPKRAAE